MEGEIKAIPALLDLLALDGAIVTIDAMGAQKEIAAKIIDKGGDYVLALKGNQMSLHEDARLFFADEALTAACTRHEDADAGHGRIEERVCIAADAAWLSTRHPAWKGLGSVAAVTAKRTDKKTGATSIETRLFLSSLAPDPKPILAAVGAHWAIENSLHWTMDVTFDEDRCRTRKDNSALGLAVVRHAALNLLKTEPSKTSIRRKRLKAAINPSFRSAVFST